MTLRHGMAQRGLELLDTSSIVGVPLETFRVQAAGNETDTFWLN